MIPAAVAVKLRFCEPSVRTLTLLCISRLSAEIWQRIHTVAVDTHFKVQMRARNIAGRADTADALPRRNRIARRHAQRTALHMRIQRGKPVAVVDDHVLAVAGMVPCRGHPAAARRNDRKAGASAAGASNVDCPVIPGAS